jgi:hypothetical protein
MKIIRITPLLFIIFFYLPASAQRDTSAKSSSMNIFETEVKQEKLKKTKIDSTIPKNVLKINPLLFINGDVPVYYERVLTKILTIELAPGITIHNYGAGFFPWLNNLSNDNIGASSGLPYDSGWRFNIGYSFKADARFYLGKYNLLDGVYLSPEIGFRHYSIDYLNYDADGEPIPVYTHGYTNVTDFKILFGDENPDAVNNLFFNSYIGIGFRRVTGVDYGKGLNGITYYTSTNNESFWQFTLYLGFEIGLGVKD